MHGKTFLIGIGEDGHIHSEIGEYYHYCNIYTDIVIHAGALTRPMVVHQERPHDSIETNIIGSSNVVLGCMKFDMKVIYVSTDYVYEGIDGNYKEDDPLLPIINLYIYTLYYYYC